MRLYYWRGYNGKRNFGDELNPWIWPQVVGEHLSENSDDLFVGIGTILNDNLNGHGRKYVMGSGTGYGQPPKVDHLWKFYAVRGPLTAERLGLSPDLAITDPGILVSRYHKYSNGKERHNVSFMPHWLNVHRGWIDLCDDIGFKFINPLDPVEKVLDEIAASELLLAEAMHGAICADALRVPWIPISIDQHEALPFKWEDWCRSMEIEYRPQPVDRLRDKNANRNPIKRLIKKILEPSHKKAVGRQLTTIAHEVTPTLSKESVLKDRLQKLDDAIGRFKLETAAGFVLFSLINDLLVSCESLLCLAECI